MTACLLPVIAYLLGSISSAIVIARLFGLKDPREVGSGNPGATNILRYGGKKAAILTLLGDVLKGVAPVLIAHTLGVDSVILALTMLAAFLGHVFPVFHGFKGGKGVATAFGALAAMNGWVGLALVGSWLVMAITTRYSSLSAITVSVLAPVFVWWFVREPALILATGIMALLLLWRHRSNIQKLLAGTETKIGR
ncbi:MAG TPA: glycerol-3-phosphate 1-O-acyltransferase PlsY [Acidiferrobacterales bacterium]|nr:glycerol-3-phosphate 1-O-acyltransferase PlsY [Acidiferrobacterales bacterium]